VAEDPREPYGRTFHEQGRIPVNAEREKPFNVGPWEDRTEEQREIDMRGASAVAAQAVADAGLEHKRMRAQIFALDANRPAIFEALRFTAASAEYGSQAKRYLAALKALGGDEEGDGRV
jgi:hypothetical protein